MSRVPLSNDLVAKAFPGFQRTIIVANQLLEHVLRADSLLEQPIAWKHG